MLAEIEHRGHLIKKDIDSRRVVRRTRRNRKTRYRPARFLNRTKPKGWLTPSVKSRANNVINFIKKYKKLLNITKVMIESVSFDTAQMASDDCLIGIGYQQGPLYNTNLKNFVFSKTNGRCSYCGAPAQEIDHIIPKANGGTDSSYNLTPACRSCNQMKSNKTLKEFGKLVGKDFSHLAPKKLPKDASIVILFKEAMDIYIIMKGERFSFTIFMTLPELFITDYEAYYNQVKTEIEDNNKAAEAEYRVWEKNNTEVLDKEKEVELEKDKGEYLRLKKKLEEAGVKL